jgi:hypothetical protein
MRFFFSVTARTLYPSCVWDVQKIRQSVSKRVAFDERAEQLVELLGQMEGHEVTRWLLS